MTLPDAIHDAMPSDNRLRVGTVLRTFPTVVDVQGAQVPAGSLASYNPRSGDVVTLLRQEGTWLILGLNTSPTSGAYPSFQAGYVAVSVTAATSNTGTKTFEIPFRNPPAVTIGLSSAPGATSQWHVRAINITETGFTWFIFGPSSTFTIDASWIALERTD